MICDPANAAELFRRAAVIRAVATDVDGVLTAGQIVLTDCGEHQKHFSALDGFAIKMAAHAGLVTAIISASKSQSIRHRAAELGFDAVYIGSYSKVAGYESFKQQHGLEDAQICYIGDDVPDIPLFRLVGLPVAVANAAPDAYAATSFHTRVRGGDGAVREVLEFILHAQNRRESVVREMVTAFESK